MEPISGALEKATLSYKSLEAELSTLGACLTALEAEMEGMREIVRAVAKGEPEHGGMLPDGEIYGHIRVSPLELKEQAQAFLSHEPSDMVVVRRATATARHAVEGGKG